MEREKIDRHLRQLLEQSGMGNNEESLAQLHVCWEEKLEAFEAECKNRGMEEVESLYADESRGALIITYSGSIITIGPDEEGSRTVSYHSIGMRSDVPESADAEETSIVQDLGVDQQAAFSNGPIERSSPILRIAVVPEQLDEEEQSEMLGDMTQILSQQFADVNKTVVQ